ncbi:hypothetical protein VIGAN_01100400 [Vigna angularis var. angularis]|uniref:Uncharacterized protein n=1 Tax=Vigna angularis var. angularis TaxID=157739 RepID=A0A0S3QYV2_PHAAN|nr:hypothetical protein VIGAN_01100400 [Vigna angularis var. angularis]
MVWGYFFKMGKFEKKKCSVFLKCTLLMFLSSRISKSQFIISISHLCSSSQYDHSNMLMLLSSRIPKSQSIIPISHLCSSSQYVDVSFIQNP